MKHLLVGFNLFNINSKLYITIILILVFIYLILTSISAINRIILTKKEEQERRYKLLEKIKKIDPYLDEQKLIDDIFKIYNILKEASYKQDLKTIKKYVTKEFCEEYTKKLKTSNKKMIKMDNIVLDIGKLLDISKKNNTIKIRVYMSVISHNYLIDTINNKPIKGGKNRYFTSYMFTFVKTIDKCPYCLNVINEDTVCKKCKKEINYDNYDWIMAKKEIINKGRY